ncbi:hypothetical protein T484DRAFT_1774975 [Baffinella frigidus]|nr:hypothetical protein T484DRAFT_1774975 [Cryptophyta sp. CCMP2293]
MRTVNDHLFFAFEVAKLEGERAALETKLKEEVAKLEGGRAALETKLKEEVTL